jgi:pimeloyl-ACP methyl ester carboxylesterase
MLIIMGILILPFFIYAFDQEMHEKMCDFLTTPNKYMRPEGTLERISFHSAKNAESTETILRDGFLLKRKEARAVVFILNGFMCTKFESSFLRALLFPEYHVVTFDFRAHGKNIDECQYCTFGRDEANDVIAAVNYIKSRDDLKDLPRIAYGFSMGAVAAIEAQALHPDLFDMMILDCPYDRSKNVIKKGLENMQFNFWGYSFALPGRSFLEKYAFHPYIQAFLKTLLKTVANMDATAINTYIYPVHPVNSIKKITVPCFFIHCNNDEKVPVEAAQNLFRNAAGFKRLWRTAGRGHFDSFFVSPEIYGHRVREFMEMILDKTYLTKKQEKVIEDKYS